MRFHVPSFLIDGGDVVVGQRGIAGDQIENARAAIFVYEDLLDEERRSECISGMLAGHSIIDDQLLASDPLS